MSTPTEKFTEQFPRIQQQFKDWTQLEQLYSIVELTRKFQLSYRYFLLQWLEVNIRYENDDMFNHTVDDANAPDIVSCLLSNSLDKILFTVQLYLPLISTKTISEKLLEAYRDVLIYLDKNILNSTKFSYTEQQIIHFSQHILFFIQTNPCLQKLSSYVPQLIQLMQSNKFHSDEQQQFHQSLQRHSSVRSKVLPLMNYLSDSTGQNAVFSQQLTRHETSDSGVDLSEPSMSNPMRNSLSSPNHPHAIVDRSNRTNLSSSPSITQHSYVAKTASSPIPEHSTINLTSHTPLKNVLSAPPSTRYSDHRQNASNYPQQKQYCSLAKSDEEPESQRSMDKFNTETKTSTSIKPYSSLRYSNAKINQNKDGVSPYLGVDTSCANAKNTFIQPNTGMRDVPKWLKHLRLHKYDAFFSQIDYNDMMNLTLEKLKQSNITDGACTKILLHIQKLKDRSALLQRCLVDLDYDQQDLQEFVQQLSELLITPIRSRQLELENNSDEDLPTLIMQVLEKINKRLTSNSSADIGNSLLGLFDRCYKHEAFTYEQRLVLLQWRRRLSDTLQSLGKIEYKTIQSTSVHSSQQRRTTKPPVRYSKSTNGIYNSINASSATLLSKTKSELQSNNNATNSNSSSMIDTSSMRRPNKSPTQIYSANDESSDVYFQTSFSGITSTPQRNNGAYLANNQHQALMRKPSINPYDERSTNNRTKLCQTFSDPSKIRFYNPLHTNPVPLAPSQSVVQQQNSFRMISTPYSQHQKPFSSRSPPLPTTMELPASPIKKCFSDDERSDYFVQGAPADNISSPMVNDIENTDDQRIHNTEMESLCRQITESAINDETNDLSFNYQQNSDALNAKQSSNSSTDTEQ